MLKHHLDLTWLRRTQNTKALRTLETTKISSLSESVVCRSCWNATLIHPLVSKRDGKNEIREKNRRVFTPIYERGDSRLYVHTYIYTCIHTLYFANRRTASIGYPVIVLRNKGFFAWCRPSFVWRICICFGQQQARS